MTMILKDGTIFLHVPKTGGMWVTKVLTEIGLSEVVEIPGNRHFTLDRALDKVWDSHRDTFLFCFVRHPVKWYESWFNYMSQHRTNWRSWGEERAIKKNWHPNSILNGCGSNDFNVFVRNVIKKRPGYVTELYGWYTGPRVDFIGKQENLAEDLIRVLKLRGLRFDEDYIRSRSEENVSATASRLEWDPALRAEVERLEYAGIVRYGYGD